MRTQHRSLLAAVLLAAAVVPTGTAAAATRPAARPTVLAAGRAPRPAGPARGRAAARRSYVPGRLLVGFRPGVTGARRGALLGTVGARPGAVHGRVQVGTLARTADVRAAAERLAGEVGVAWAEPDWLRHLDACGAGVDCWHLDASHGVDADAAHTAGKTGGGSTVAVVDTGVAGIADLGARVVSRRACNAGGTCTTSTVAPAISHGTEVASLVAAADDDRGITGVAPDAHIRAWKVDDANGGIPVSALVGALQEIASNPTFADVDVVNLSLGGPQSSTAEQHAIDAVLAAGKSVVASAGNDGSYLPEYPSAYPGVISVGATTKGRGVSHFSSYGKVDVVAPGERVTVDTPTGGTAVVDGTSFASPIVAGVIALDPTGGALRNRLALEGTADAAVVASTDAKPTAHGLADADAYVQSFGAGASAYLVAETSGPVADPVTAAASGQLANPATTLDAYVLKSDGSLGSAPAGTADFSVDGASVGSDAAAADVGGGVFEYTSGAVTLARGATHTGTAALGGTGSDDVPVRALRADDQAPGVALVGAGDDAWNRRGTLQGGADGQAGDDNLDDVYAVYLAAGDTLDAALTRQGGNGVFSSLYRPGTTDVASQLDRIVACGDSPPTFCSAAAIHYRAPAAGSYLLDVYAVGSELGPSTGAYRLSWTVKNTAGVPVSVRVGACSPNGDHVQDTCAWSVGGVAGYSATSYLTSGSTTVLSSPGTGARSWDGTVGGAAERDGVYTLRVLYTLGAGRRALLRTFPLVLDRARPKVANLVVAPNPFEPVPRDRDRDTTTFAISSDERSRLRVLVYKYATATLLRTIDTVTLPAGRQRVSWDGRTLAGRQLRGRLAFQVRIVDPAGNTYQTLRHAVTIR